MKQKIIYKDMGNALPFRIMKELKKTKHTHVEAMFKSLPPTF